MDISSDAQFILDLTQRAGEMARAAYNPTGVAFDLKSDRSPVTEHDIAINQMIIDVVQKERPEWGVLGEELQWNTEPKKLLVVDPIDGTRPFTFGMPVFGFLAALVEDGEPTIGVMSNPVVRRTLWAEKGNGAYHFESGTRLAVNESDVVDGQVCSVSASSTSCSHLRKNIYLVGSRAMSIQSASESAALVALGHLVGDYHELKSAHDVAAAKIVIEEAGGKVTDIEGNEQRYDQPINGAIISNGKVHDELLQLYAKSVAEDKADPAYEN